MQLMLSQKKYMSVVEANVDKKVTALMNVNDCEVRFQLDSAADVATKSTFLM
jgi:hypothetical protein